MCNFSKYVGKCMKVDEDALKHLDKLENHPSWYLRSLQPIITLDKADSVPAGTEMVCNIYLLPDFKNVFWIWNILLNIQKNTARSMFLLTLMAGTLWASLVRLEMLEWIGSEPIDLSSDNWSIKLLIVLPVPVYCWTNGCELFCHSVRKLKYTEK